MSRDCWIKTVVDIWFYVTTVLMYLTKTNMEFLLYTPSVQTEANLRLKVRISHSTV